jgi:hypothetical protein
MRGDEKRVIDAYVTWLKRNNWTVQREVNFTDVYAERGDERLYAEAKGRTGRIQPVCARSSASLSDGVMWPRVLRGWPFSLRAIRAISSAECPGPG